MSKLYIHENLNRSHRIPIGTERSFAFVFTFVFAFSGYLLGFDTLSGVSLLGLAGFFLCIGLTFPKLLRPLNVIWFKLGLALGKIVNPIIMGIIYCVSIVPVGLAMRLAKKDPLRLRMPQNTNSYWIDRDPPGPPPSSMKNQF